MAKPLNRPFRALRTLKKAVAEAEAQAAAEKSSRAEPERLPESFAEVARADGVSQAATGHARRVSPPQEPAALAVAQPPEKEHAFAVRVDLDEVHARRDDVEPFIFAWLARQDPVATVDLHGHNAAQARRSLHRFVRARAKRGDSVVLVITGVGRRSKGAAVLKNEAPDWLTEARMHAHVRAFITAPQRHGGAGALLVLLAAAPA